VAEDVDHESKTEDPTPRRREEARKQGQVPFSAELVGSAVLLAAVIGLMYLGPPLWRTMLDVFRADVPRACRTEFGPAEAQEVMQRTFLRVLAGMAAFFGVLLAVGIAASVAQVGFQINTEKLTPNFEKLNPAEGWGRLFSTSALVKVGLMALKIAALGAVGYWVLEPRTGALASLSRGSLPWAAAASWDLVIRLGLYLVSAVALVAVIDYVYQRYKFEQSLRMTKEELKRELKEEDGDPEIKARIRQLQREMSRKKMLAEVPKATVIVTNPTHYAVALRYASGRGDAAPVVVAKGTGLLAKRITELARGAGVPVLERPVLARALYAEVKEGQAIPGALFRAVAEVLAFVYRLRGAVPQRGAED
jgi:flagellar biosynthetic protein FlhB